MTGRPEEVGGVCSQCHANTTFQMDPYEQALMSDCCYAPEYNPPTEPDDA